MRGTFRITLLAIFSWQLCASIGSAQPDARLLDARRCYEFGDYRRAAALLEGLPQGGSDGEQRAALRLQALTYRASGAPRLAAMAARDYLDSTDASPLTSEDRLEVLGVLADSLAEQGDWEQAVQALQQSAELLKDSGNAGSVRMLQIRSRLIEVADRLRGLGADLPFYAELGAEDSLDQYRNAGRYQVLKQLVESALQRDQPAEAIAILKPALAEQQQDQPDSEGLSQEQACEIHVLYARCLAASDDQAEAAHEVERSIRAFARWRRTLHESGRESLGLPEAERMLSDARAVQRIGDLLEWRAELADPRDTRFRVSCLRKSWGAYARVQEGCHGLAAAHQDLAAANPAAARRAALDQRVTPLLDSALSGIQRVTTRLLQEDDQLSRGQRSRLTATRLAASRGLIALREQRLLPDDPRLVQARSALAVVLLDEDKPVEAAEEFHRLGEELASATHVEAWQVAQNKLNYSTALIAASLPADARQVLLDAPAVERKDPLLQARIESMIGLASVLIGDYRAADARLGKADRLAQSVEGDAASVQSQTALYRALLLKSEARFNEAVQVLNEGRNLHMASPRSAAKHLVAYNLVEASIHLSAVAEQFREGPTSADRLKRVVHLLRTSRDTAESAALGAAVAENLELLESYSLAQSGAGAEAQGKLQMLARNEGYSVRTRALAELALAQYALQTRLHPPGEPSSSEQPVQRLRAALRHTQAASDHLGSAGDDSYPSLQFKAAYQTAQLHAGLERLRDPMKSLPAPLVGDREQLASFDGDAPTHADAAIQELEKAIKLAERPAASNTLQRQERSRFFTRYAAAYDLLADLSTRRAIGDTHAGEAVTRSEQPQRHAALVRAITVADQARNRTFREQLAESAGEAASSRFRFDDLGRILKPDDAMIVYQLSGARRSTESPAGTPDSAGSYLYLVSDQGDTIRAFPLSDETRGGAPLTRQAAAELVSGFVSDLSELPGNRQRRFLTENRTQKLQTTESLLPAKVRGLLQRSSRLVIVPDGALHQLPFEALVVQGGGDFEGEVGYALDQLPPMVYGPSLSVLAAIDPTPRSAGTLSVVSVGGANFGGPEIPAWRALAARTGIDKLAPLPAAEAECRRVYESFTRLPNVAATLLVGADATEEAVRRAAPSAGVLHLATHAVVDPENDNLYGAIALTPDATPNDASHDGLLHLGELYELDLSACHLAILSACQTLIGADRPLEAGMSFSRAMLELGARRVVASQWSINDQATAELIEDFSNRVSSDLAGDASVDYCQALYAAKRALKESRPDPYFWAPLVLVGAP
ncbi:MAG: CHAT domain-containing protein [Planctomycetales bacterium]|nr:CHAT domain-containing protein [Planctomycetales bacterium]